MITSLQKDDLKDRDGNLVTVLTTLFPGSTGVEMFSRVFLLTVPVILPALDADDKKEMDFSKISAAIATTFTDKKIIQLVLDIVQFSELIIRDGKNDNVKQELRNKSIFDQVFAGNYALLIQVIKYVLEVNFKDFFGENGIKDLMTLIPGIVKTK